LINNPKNCPFEITRELNYVFVIHLNSSAGYFSVIHENSIKVSKFTSKGHWQFYRCNTGTSYCVVVRGGWIKRNTKNKSSIYKINKSFKSLLISVLKKTFFFHFNSFREKQLIKNLKRDFKNWVILRRKNVLEKNSHRFMTSCFHTNFWPLPWSCKIVIFEELKILS